MVDSLPVIIIIGTILGFLAGLGIGGGSLLILWLTFVLGMEHNIARGINLLFFLPSALIACFFRWKQGCIDFKLLVPAIIGGCITAGIGSWIAAVLDMTLLKKLFGGLLVLTGLRELFYRPKQEKEQP